MGKNLSKENRSKENTPEKENRRPDTNSSAPTSRPELKKHSTLQALKHLATPPGLRKSDSTRSKIQWPSSTKRTPSAKSSPQASTATPTERKEERKKPLKPAQEAALKSRGSSTNNRNTDSAQPHIDDSGTKYRWAKGAMPDWAKPDTPSKKRKSDLLGADIAEELRAKSKRKLTAEDFEKLAEYGMFEPGALCTRREGVPIPYQILEHIKIYYEEGLFKHATKLLNCICVSGRGDDSPNAPPAFVPPPSYIALLTTVMIHPSYTTDVENGKEARDNMIHATNTLLNILDAVGPKQANMKAAFQFAQTGFSGGRGSRTRRTKRHVDDDSESNPEDVEIGIGHPLAQKESVWNTATDLWHVVGWALNCSINHKERWQFYQAWLKVVAYAIDDDMEDCKDKWREAEFDPIAQGILGRTIIDPNIPNLSKTIDMKGALKRAVAACFANGKDQSLKQFPEVWKDELNPAARADKEESACGQKIFSDVPALPPTLEDMQELRQQPYSAPTDEESKEMREKAAASFGGIKALDMRCSFLARLLDFDYHIFGRKQASRDIYQIICDHVVNLPLATFTVFLSHFSTFTPRGSAASLLQCCANRLIDNKAPHNPNQDDSYDLPIMIKCFLPFAANTSTPEDNAKLSYCIDSMVRFYPHFDEKDTFDASQDYGCTRQELEAAIALGTYTRLTKCQNYKPKARNAKELEFMMETQEHRRHMIRIAGEKMHAYVHNYYFRDPNNPDHVDKKACAGFLDGITTFADLETENAVKWTGEI